MLVDYMSVSRGVVVISITSPGESVCFYFLGESVSTFQVSWNFYFPGESVCVSNYFPGESVCVSTFQVSQCVSAFQVSQYVTVNTFQ